MTNVNVGACLAHCLSLISTFLTESFADQAFVGNLIAEPNVAGTEHCGAKFC